MTLISTAQAARLINRKPQAIRDHVANGNLPARREGPRRIYRIKLHDMESLARQFNYTYDADLAEQLAGQN